MKKSLIIILFTMFLIKLQAHEYRNLLEKTATEQELKTLLISNQSWVKYPAYNDREGWDKFVGDQKEQIISKGEAYLDYEWKLVRATDYLAYKRTGSREKMQRPFNSNVNAYVTMVMAELVEGKGRFLDQIADGIWAFCDMSSWALSAHISGNLEDGSKPTVALFSAELGATLSWTYHFFKPELDKIHPVISRRLRQEIKTRVMDPFMARSDFWWMAFDAKPTQMVNNWNPWCNTSVLTCFLLLEKDSEQLAKAVHRTMISVDKFVNYVKSDGACEEGPSYWGHAAGKLYDYLQLLSEATQGKVSIFDQPMIKHMAEYIERSYIGDSWVVNFADAAAHPKQKIGLIYRFGKAIKSESMPEFAAFLYEKRNHPEVAVHRALYRTLEDISCWSDLQNTTAKQQKYKSTWYPKTQVSYLRNKSNMFLACKGGFNAESHNHNDVGTCIFFVNDKPVFIDAGVGVYTSKTFSGQRYSIWTMQSNYHNVPMINGYPQKFGSKYKATNVRFNESKSTFSLDIAQAYPKEAAVDTWKRTYRLKANALEITDNFKLNEYKESNQINFLLC